MQSIGAFSVGALLLAGFVVAEMYAAEPVLPLWVVSRRLLLRTAFISLGVGAVLIGLTSYHPSFGSLNRNLRRAPARHMQHPHNRSSQ